jgi:outer membrane lipoprotein carrier protein
MRARVMAISAALSSGRRGFAIWDPYLVAAITSRRKQMRSSGYIFAFLAVFLFTSVQQKVVWGAEANVQDVVATLEQGYKSLNDVQADFSQRTALASIKKEQRGSGTLIIKKPAGAAAMFRFDYTEPRQLIVSNGKSVWFYLPENRQVMVSDVATLLEGKNGVTVNYLTAMDHLSRDFNASFASNGRDKKGNYVLQLTPKTKSQILAKLQITVAEQAVDQFMREGKASEPFPIVSSVVYDSFGTRTTMDFSKIRVNRGVSNSRFSFKIPAGVEVIKR